MQQAFTGHIKHMDTVTQRCKLLIQAADLLGVPVIVTEQYPQGLGRTIDELQQVLSDNTEYLSKVTFSVLQNDTIKQKLLDTKRNQLLIAGIETHVCIAQTAMDAMEMGIRPYLAADAVSSRKKIDHKTALKRLIGAGATVTTTEAAIMEMTVSSKHPNFKAISKLLK